MSKYIVIWCRSILLSLTSHSSLQGQLETAEHEVESAIDEIYAQLDDHRLPARVKTALEAKVVATNQSLQILFQVS